MHEASNLRHRQCDERVIVLVEKPASAVTFGNMYSKGEFRASLQ